jgi:hypothetical protein
MNHEPKHDAAVNDPLDMLLRDENAYVPDDGFTSRVLTALPRQRQHSWMRLVFLSSSLIAGATLALWLLPPVTQIFAALPVNWSDWRWQTLFTLIPFAAVLASIGWGLFAVVSDEE